MTETTEQQIASEVLAERARQYEKWGEQNHLDGTGPFVHPLYAVDEWTSGPVVMALAVDLASAAKCATDSRAKDGSVTWLDILFEELAEAMAENEPAKLRAELVQVAAVAQQWIEAIDRRTR